MNPVDPLDQLRDLHLPPPPGWWPPAPGWWLLALVALILLLAGVWLWRKRRRANRYRRLALAELALIAAQGDSPRFLPDLIALLRRTARAANPASEWIALGAPQLLERLNQFSSGKGGGDTGHGDIAELAVNQYRPQPAALDPQQQGRLIKLARQWIRKHRSGQGC